VARSRNQILEAMSSAKVTPPDAAEEPHDLVPVGWDDGTGDRHEVDHFATPDSVRIG